MTDTGESFYVMRRNGVLLYCESDENKADTTVTCERLQFLAAMNGQEVDGIQIEGDSDVLQKMFGYTVKFSADFNIIEP